jgi:hypothetical protein
MIDTSTCPSCRRTLRVPASLQGQAVKCPACGNTFTADPAPEEAPAQEPRREPPPRQRGRPRDEDEDAPRRRVVRRDDYEDRPRRSRRDYQPHRGGLILAFGICSVLVAPLIFGPIAWVMGSQDLKEIRAGRMDPDGEGNTQVGRTLGMVMTLLSLATLLACGLIGLVVIISAT